MFFYCYLCKRIDDSTSSVLISVLRLIFEVLLLPKLSKVSHASFRKRIQISELINPLKCKVLHASFRKCMQISELINPLKCNCSWSDHTHMQHCSLRPLNNSLASSYPDVSSCVLSKRQWHPYAQQQSYKHYFGKFRLFLAHI